MDVSITVATITTAGSIASAVGVALISYQQYKLKMETTKRQRELDQREDLRAEGCMIQMEMLQAQLKLGLVTAKAVLNQKTNGDVVEAMKKVTAAEDRYAKFLRKIAMGVELNGYTT